MTQRLEPCDHTEEDAFVWAHVVLKVSSANRFGSLLWTRSLMQDRCDAQVMFVRESHWERETTSPLKWWFEDWPFPDLPPRTRTPFDAALYWWMEDRRQYLNLRRYALRIGGTTLDWPDWPPEELP